MKVLYPTQRDRARGVSVICRSQGKEVCLPRMRVLALLPILECHFQRCFDGGRTIAAEEDVSEIARSDRRQQLG